MFQLSGFYYSWRVWGSPGFGVWGLGFGGRGKKQRSVLGVRLTGSEGSSYVSVGYRGP